MYSNPRSIYYGWWIALAGCFNMALIGLYFHGAGTFVSALDDEFMWSRTLLAGAFSIARIEGSIIGPLAGYLTDKLRPHKMILIGLVIMAIGYFILSFVDTPLIFYVAFVTIAIGGGLGSFIPIATSVTYWFIKKRSLAIAIMMCGTAIGGLLVGPMAVGITEFGWRTVSLGIGGTILLVGIPLSYIFKREPKDFHGIKDKEQLATNIENSIPSTKARIEFTVKEALKTRAFWIVAISHSMVNMSFTAVVVHGVPHLTDIGMSLSVAGGIVAIYNMISLPSQIIGGWLGDKLNKRILLCCLLLIQGAAVIVFALTTNPKEAYIFAILFGVGLGGRTAIYHALRADYFGGKAFASITGIYTIPINITMAIAPILVGILFDIQHTYMYGMLFLGILAMLGGMLMLTAAQPEKFVNNST